jgi:hypothetical protein
VVGCCEHSDEPLNSHHELVSFVCYKHKLYCKNEHSFVLMIFLIPQEHVQKAYMIGTVKNRCCIRDIHFLHCMFHLEFLKTKYLFYNILYSIFTDGVYTCQILFQTNYLSCKSYISICCNSDLRKFGVLCWFVI